MTDLASRLESASPEQQRADLIALAERVERAEGASRNLRPFAEDHPGFDAPDCPLRRTVVAHRYGTSRNGYGCDWTGGHCLPGRRCDAIRLRARQETRDA